MSRYFIVACWLLCAAGVSAAQTTIPVNVHAAYLHIDPADLADNAVAIDLGSLGFLPGYTIGLECSGDWNAGPGGDVQTNLLGVFSTDTTLLDPVLLHRVPGAVSAGLYNFSGGTWPGGEPTDIAEDFLIGRPGMTVVIPLGANYLFVTPADIYYRDNSDPNGNLGVTLTLVSTSSVPPSGTYASRHLFPAQPNPFSIQSSIAFRLENTATARLTIHDITGRLVRTLVSGSIARGSHVVIWNGRDSAGRRLPAGTYYARLDGEGLAESTRMVLVY
jgi:hypothetical protein